jgi:hypothetical protein
VVKEFIDMLEKLSPVGIEELIKNTKSEVCRQFVILVLKDIAKKKATETMPKEVLPA